MVILCLTAGPDASFVSQQRGAKRRRTGLVKLAGQRERRSGEEDDSRALAFSFQYHISDDPTCLPERLLRLAVQRGLDAAGVAEREGKLILRFPPCPFTGTEQGLDGATAVDLDHNPTKFDGLQIEHERFRGARSLHRQSGQGSF